MKITKKASAGSLESSDLMIHIEPAGEIKIEAKSSVSTGHGTEIEEMVQERLEKEGIHGAYIKIQDNGALDLTIEARLSTVLKRGSK